MFSPCWSRQRISPGVPHPKFRPASCSYDSPTGCFLWYTLHEGCQEGVGRKGTRADVEGSPHLLGQLTGWQTSSVALHHWGQGSVSTQNATCYPDLFLWDTQGASCWSFNCIESKRSQAHLLLISLLSETSAHLLQYVCDGSFINAKFSLWKMKSRN